MQALGFIVAIGVSMLDPLPWIAVFLLVGLLRREMGAAMTIAVLTLLIGTALPLLGFQPAPVRVRPADPDLRVVKRERPKPADEGWVTVPTVPAQTVGRKRGPDPARDVRGMSWEQYDAVMSDYFRRRPVDLGEYAGAIASSVWAATPAGAFDRFVTLSGVEQEARAKGEPILSAEQATAIGKDWGLFFDRPISRRVVDRLVAQKQNERADADVFRRERLNRLEIHKGEAGIASQETGYAPVRWLVVALIESVIALLVLGRPNRNLAT